MTTIISSITNAVKSRTFLLLLVVVVALGISHAQRDKCGVRLHNQCLILEITADQSEREHGLSGRNELPENHGMLFVFDDSQAACMWMKDMKFSLDLLWLNQQKKITKIEENVSPATYPKTFCSDQTKYVIEVNAGVISHSGLAVGQTLQL